MHKDPFDYLLPFHVTLAKPGEYPHGSGTLLQFPFSPHRSAFIILTASHIADELGLIKPCIDLRLDNNVDVIVCKPKNRNGEQIATLCPSLGLALELDPEHERHLKENHKETYFSERDITVLLLSIEKTPQGDVFNNSTFLNMNDNLMISNSIRAPQVNDPYIFYKGACLDDEIDSEVLKNTGIEIVKHIEIKTASRSKLPYIELLSTNNSLKGASGSGLWRCYQEGNNIQCILEGVIVEKKKKLRAIHISYVYEYLFPRLRQRLLADFGI